MEHLRVTNRAGSALLLAATFVAGCGPNVVRTDGLSRVPVQSVPPGTPVRPVSSGEASGSIPEVPAEDVVNLPSERSGTYHEVRRGDTLSAIARANGTTVDELLDANGLERDAVLQPGQLIFVPQ